MPVTIGFRPPEDQDVLLFFLFNLQQPKQSWLGGYT